MGLLDPVPLWKVVLVLFAWYYTGVSATCNRRGLFERLKQCDALWGFDLGVFQRNDFGYVLHLDQLIAYCRNPKREDIYGCVRAAYGSCSSEWRHDFSYRDKQNERLGGRAFDYLCSNVDLISSNQTCIEGQIWPLTACFRTAGEDFITDAEEKAGNRGRGQKWARNKDNIRKLGQRVEQCVYKTLEDSCGTAIANVFGNFLYGTLVFPFRST